MNAQGLLQLALFVLVIGLLTKPLGAYLFRVYEGAPPLPGSLGRLERLLYRGLGVDPTHEQDWKEYARALLAFSAVGVLITYALLRLQGWLPLNPEGKEGLSPALAFNTAVSFTTNTNWQSYAAEVALSYFSQMAALAWHNFVSAAAGMGVALAVARGLTRAPGGRSLGNFWVDLVRGLVYVLLPLCLLLAPFLLWQGVPQTFAPYLKVQTLAGGEQLIALGPVASQEAIKMLGTNGGGFFNANSAHPFENPTPLTNFVEMVMIFAIPAALTYTYGRMIKDQRQGWALFAAMMALFLAAALAIYAAEAQPNPLLTHGAIDQTAGNLEGKELRFGLANTAIFAAATTDASCGAVNGMHASFSPLGGLVTMLNIQLGEIVFGGVGAGLYGILVFALLAVFLAGLMVGRTPEFLGKKIEAREMKLAVLYVLIAPLLILGLTAWSAVSEDALSSRLHQGPHGLSELLYAYSSATGNNGSAFAGLSADTPWFNLTLGLAMLAGRFLMILPVLAIAGSMRGKKLIPPGPGTFPTGGWLFAALLVAVIVVVGALTFFPALSLGPVVEHFLLQAGHPF